MDSNGSSKTAVNLDEFEQLRQLDRERDALVNRVIEKYNDLYQRYEEKCKQCDRDTEVRIVFQDAANKAKRQLEELRHMTDTHCFVYAIIDGDGAVFREELISQGEDGGTQAAHELQTAIERHLKRTYPDVNVNHWKVVVQVALNLGGLSRALERAGLVHSSSELYAFARGFGRAKGLFSVVDVGFGKEQADFKTRELLRLMVRNVQCKHIIFGPCHDKGYLVELKPYQLEEGVKEKITLLETTPAPPEFKELGYRRVALSSVFRSEPIPSPMFLSSPRKSLPPSTMNIVRGASATPEPTGAWSSSLPMRIPSDNTTPATAKYVLVNRAGERVDEQLPRYDSMYDQRLGDRKRKEQVGPCNNYHLLGACNNAKCTYFHGERLSEGEQVVLKNGTRGTPCFHKRTCRDVDCIWGHQCKYGDRCAVNGHCKFADTHGKDPIPAAKVFEDGTEVALTF